MPRPTFLVVVAILIVILAYGAKSYLDPRGPQADASQASQFEAEAPAKSQSPRPPVVGQPLAAIELQTPDGTTVSTSDFSGRPLVIHFWATWCKYCRAELENLKSLHDAHPDDLAIVEVNVGETRGTVAEFLSEHDYGWTFLLDPDQEVYDRMGFVGIPVTIWVDPQGTVINIHYGVMPEDRMEGWLIELKRGL